MYERDEYQLLVLFEPMEKIVYFEILLHIDDELDEVVETADEVDEVEVLWGVPDRELCFNEVMEGLGAVLVVDDEDEVEHYDLEGHQLRAVNDETDDFDSL
jgi:hypothetical protein